MCKLFSDNDLILVTGAGGYHATHCIKRLLQKVRSLKDSKKCDPLKKRVYSLKHELE